MPLQQTQAGALEHKQIYLTEMLPREHSQCKDIIRKLRGSHSTSLTRYVTHVVVSVDCQQREKVDILQLAEECAGSCCVVWTAWLHACKQVHHLLVHTCDTTCLAVFLTSVKCYETVTPCFHLHVVQARSRVSPDPSRHTCLLLLQISRMACG